MNLPIRAVVVTSDESKVGMSAWRGEPPLRGRKILVVDDDRDGRDLVAAALRYAGADVSAVASGADALDCVKNYRPDLVLTDIAMPEMDGYALQRKLREQEDLASTKIVALTAFPANVMSADEEEFDSYLRKPIDPYELAERVRELLRPAGTQNSGGPPT